MPYAAASDLTRYLGKYAAFFTATSVPSNADAQQFLDSVAGEIDAALSGRGIPVPVTLATAPQSFLDFLEETNAIGAAAQIVAALFPQAAGPASSTYQDFLDRQYEQRLVSLRRGEGVPDVVSPSGGGSMARSFWTTHPYDDAGNEREPAFTRDMKW